MSKEKSDKTFKKTFVRKVRDYFEESQSKFAERFGVDQSTIHDWETKGLPERGTTRLAFAMFVNALPPDWKRTKKKSRAKKVTQELECV